MREPMGTPLDHCADLPERTFAAGGVVIAEGVASALFVLVDGAVEILKGDVCVNVVDEPGAIFGEVSALLGVPPMATVRALSPSRFRVADDGAAFIASRPELAIDVARLLAARLTSVTGYLIDVKKQFEDQRSHLGIVDEVLEALVSAQGGGKDDDRGSDREPDPNC
jgi:CRP/FNR family cyclic AMP-dependent transcriptional regulator